jgi:amidase
MTVSINGPGYEPPRSRVPAPSTTSRISRASTMTDLRWTSASEQARLLRAGDVTPAELHETAMQAIEATEPAVHAIVAPLFDRPPSGVPMLLKDAGQEIDGTPHWVGVAALRDVDARSSRTTTLVRRFEDVGFSVIGKSACPQLSTGITTEPPGFEPTRNPWDVTRSAGGSSGGSAAAVASGMVALAHGSDATGSLRCPASLCGIATLNPTSGRVATVPPAGQPFNHPWREFVLARHGEDLAFVFESLTTSTIPDSLPSLRVGVLDHDPEFDLSIHSACREAVQLAARRLEGLGHRVEVSWPAPLRNLWARTLEAVGVVSDAIRPVMISWVAERLGRPLRRGELEASVFEAADRAGHRSKEDVAAAGASLDAAMSPVSRWWDDHDLLVTPTTFQPAWRIGAQPGPAEMGGLLAPFSFTGQPALSLPLHHSEEGLPVGVQVVGPPGGDEMLLRLACDLQAECDWSSRRPNLA